MFLFVCGLIGVAVVIRRKSSQGRSRNGAEKRAEGQAIKPPQRREDHFLGG